MKGTLHHTPYQILKHVKENERCIFMKVPSQGDPKKTVELNLVAADPESWAKRVAKYLSLGRVPPEDIRPPEEHKGGVIATCGHAVTKVMWEVTVEENGEQYSMVVCPTCFSRYYRTARRTKGAVRVLLGGR